MIQLRTVMEVADNSGAKKVQCIKVLGGTGRRYASVGDIIVVAVKECEPQSQIKKSPSSLMEIQLTLQVYIISIPKETKKT